MKREGTTTKVTIHYNFVVTVFVNLWETVEKLRASMEVRRPMQADLGLNWGEERGINGLIK